MQAITPDMEAFLLHRVKPLATIGLVGGSDFAKISKQMGGEDVSFKFDYVFCENGLVHYQNGQLMGAQTMIQHVGEDLSQRFINFCLQYMSNLRLPAKRGNFVEFRTGMMNISPVGRSCSQAEREDFARYDEQHQIRKKFVAAMQEAFPDSGLKFSIGGQISIDVFPIGWDKTYSLNRLGGDFEEIHFYGDKTDIGGNDYEIYEDSRTIGHKVKSPEDTKEQLAKFFNLNL